MLSLLLLLLLLLSLSLSLWLTLLNMRRQTAKASHAFEEFFASAEQPRLFEGRCGPTLRQVTEIVSHRVGVQNIT